MGRVTIKSIAADLGLSRNTVSLAFKGSALVTPQTKERIMRYAEKIGYIDSPESDEPFKQDINTKEVLHVMILRRTDQAVYWDKVVGGISAEASANNFQTQVAVITPEEEKALQLPFGLNKDIKAVFCINLFSAEYLNKIKELGILIFLLDAYADSNGEPWGDIVKMESHKAVQEIVLHLSRKGIKKIGFLNEHSHLYESMYDRYTGFMRGMERVGLPTDPSIVLPDAECPNFYSLETFEKIVDNFKEMAEAIICGNDEIAKHLTQSLRNKGFQVPKDVAVTGFDNDEEGMLNPFFTTVKIDTQWMGRRMVQCFVQRLANPDAPYEKVVISGQTIIRKSSQK